MTTKAQDDAIVRMYPDPAVSMADIQTVTKMSPAHIRVRAKRLGVQRPTMPRRVVSRRSEPEGIASWLASLSGRTASPDAPEGPTGLSEDVGRVWLDDPVAFVQALGPHPLLPYQEDWMRAIVENR